MLANIVIGAALALAVCVHATGQPSAGVPRIGFLQAHPSANDPRFAAFKQKLRELGHVEGRTMSIEYLSAEGKYERLPELAAQLVGRNVDVLMADGGTPPISAARKATQTIPSVFCGVADPVAQGFVASLARPGGNITGLSVQHPDFATKALQLLRDMLPSARRIVILSNPTNSSLPLVIEQMRSAAPALGLEVQVVEAKSPDEFEAAFAEIARIRAAGVMILREAMFLSQAARITALAAKHRLPTMGGDSAVAERGALSSYGPNTLDMVRGCAALVDKILKGARPAELPVEQPTKFDLVINMKTAKGLGIAIPQSLLLRADRVID